MTERLYYRDPYLREFDATLLDTVSYEGQTALILDRTAFYPSSGGQPHDVGSFHDVRVLEVVDVDEAKILHVVDRAPSTTSLHGTIDWTRRFDHMQQHTGQHVLSAAFDRLLAARTESFHLGTEESTIDLAREVTPAEIARAEQEANRIVWEDRPVAIRFASAEEAASLGLRKESKREGTLRLIEIEGFDLSACGGTHVARTGGIGMIVVSGTERFKGGSRVTFLCGGRALQGFRALRDVVASSVRVMSVVPGELPGAIERLQGEGKELRRQLKDVQLRLAVHEADALADAATLIGPFKFVGATLPGWDVNAIKTIASRVIERPTHVVVLLSEPAPASIVIARSADVALDSGSILKHVIAKHGGKGGGRAELAQGGGITAPAADVLQSVRDTLGASA
jgi:alanyl-tRNA synthetase